MAEDFASLLPDLSHLSDEDLQSIAGSDSSSDNPYLAAQMNQESGGQDYDKNGNVLTSPKGAKGKMQVLDSTNLDPGYGVTPARDDSLEERARVGRDYSAALQKHYGDHAMGLAAYNWGPGNFDKWLKNGGDPAHLPAETKTYIKNILGTGKQYAAADTGIQTDAQYDNSAPTPDLSHLSDEDLQAIAGNSQDLSHLSDEQLMSIASGQTLPGMAGAENMQAPAPVPAPVAPTGPQVPFMGNDGNPIPPAAPRPTAGLMLAGSAPEPNVLDKLSTDWDKTKQEMGQNEAASLMANEPYSTRLFNRAGSLAGMGWNGLADISHILPGQIPELNNALKNPLENAWSDIKSGIGQNLNPGISDAVDQAKAALQANPGIARELSSANNLAMIAPFAKPAMAGIGALDDAMVGAAPKIADRLTPMGYGEFADKTVAAGNEAAGMKAAKAEIPTGDELAADASSVYKSLPADAEALNTAGVDKFASEISAVAPQTRAGKIVTGDSALTKIVDRIAGKVDPETGERMGGLKGQPLTMAEAQEVDEALGDHVDDLTDGTTGRLTKQGKKVLDVQTAFRKAIQEGGTEGGDQLALARAKWAQASRMRDIERINARAELMENPITARKTGYRNLYLRLQKNSMGYSPQEIALVKRAADSGVATNVLKLMGSRLGPLMAGAAGGAAGGPLGAALAYGTDYAVAGGARGLANKIHLGRDTAVKQAIADRPMPIVRPQAAAPAIPEAAPAAPEVPKQITFQPDIIAGSGAGAVAQPATGEQMAHAEAARRLRVELGIDQDPAERRPSPAIAAAEGEVAAGNNQQGSASPTLPTDPFAQLSPENKKLADEVRHPVHGHTYREALAIVNDRKDTFDPKNITPERQALQSKVADELYGNGARTKGKRIDIVMGPPGAGKSSSIVKNLLEKHGGIEIDADSVKEKLPEYDHGLGANQAHGESKWITQQMPDSLLGRARANGDNIVHPVVGKDLNRMQELIDNWHDAGYNVNVHYADVPVETSVNRVINRYGSKGRALPLSYVINEVGEKPRHVFEQVIKGSKVNDYSHYNTDVPTGQKQILIKSRTDGIREGAVGDGHVLGSGPGSVGEISGGARRSEPEAYKPEVKAPISEGKPIKVHAHGEPDTAITPTGKEFDVRHAVVSGDDLIASNLDNMRVNPAYPQILQPRDRTSMQSRQQITKYANDLNPRLLMDNPLSSEGAPIISKDGVVESGNGRTLSIKRAMANNTEGAAKYKKALKDAGYNIQGVKNPVLVRIRETPMTDAERIKLAQDSNADSKLGMSSVEHATQDAKNISSATLSKYRGGDIKLHQNAEFAKSALKDMMPDNELGSVIGKDGGLSQEAQRRIEGALLHKAYGDEAVTRLLTENTDNEITSLGKALTSSAPAWAKMRDAAAKGSIPKNMDITPGIVKAVKLIQRARRDGKPLSDYFRMDDMFNGKEDPRLGLIIRNLHTSDQLTRFKSADKITKILTDYTKRAEQTSPDINLFGEKPMNPDDVLDSIFKEGVDDDETSGA